MYGKAYHEWRESIKHSEAINESIQSFINGYIQAVESFEVSYGVVQRVEGCKKECKDGSNGD